MILAVDVQYAADEQSAVVAGMLFSDFSDTEPQQQLRVEVGDIAPYVPGQFYLRELPCIMALLDALVDQPGLIVVDGYVHLGAEQRPGLGHHLYHALNEQVAVVGVAKKAFADTPESCAIYRGESSKPLYVTALGIDQDEAYRLVQSMAGQHRIPTLLKRVDQLARGIHC